MKIIILTKAFLFVISIILTTSRNSSSKQHKIKENELTFNIRSCSKWNRAGETIVGSELNTHLNDLERISIIGINTLYVIDRYNEKIRLQIFPNGSIVGQTLSNEFYSILFIDKNETIYTSSINGYIKRWFKNARQGKKTICKCNQCSRIYFDSKNQDFYIVEPFHSHIIKCNIHTNKTIIIAGITNIDGYSNKTLSYPYSLYVNNAKDIYITDVNNHRIQKLKVNTTSAITIAGQTRINDKSNEYLNRPYDIIADNNGFIYIADMINHRLIRWKEGESHGYVILGISGESGNSTYHLNRPKSLAFDTEGNLYVADIGNSRVQKFTINNTDCLLSETKFAKDRWILIREKLQKSKVDNYIGLGYNPLKGSPICYTDICQRKGFGLPIFKLKYFVPLKKTCTNNFTLDNIQIDCIPSQNLNIETQIINTLRDLKEYILKIVDFSTSRYINSSFSYGYSKEIHSIIDMIMKDNSTIVITSSNVTSIHLSINESKVELSDDFRYIIDNMPCCDFNETVEKYIHKFLIEYFGYTFIKNVQLGGFIQQIIVLTQNNRTNLEKNNFNISMKNLAKEIFLNQIKSNQSQTYNNKYFPNSDIIKLGGNISIESFDDWYKSVSDNPTLVKFGISTVFELLTNVHFPTDSYIIKKAELIKLSIDRYLSKSVYCYNQCIDNIHGKCFDSGYFQFGICQCKPTWTGIDCATPIQHYIDTFNNNVIPIWKTKAGMNSSLDYKKGETILNIFDHNIHTKYTSSNDIISLKSGLNTGFYLTFNVSICIVNGFQFITATSHPKGDPFMITLEGSNDKKSLLTFGNSWTLIYNGSSGLEYDPGRGKVGLLQMFNNSQHYRSYRLLVIMKRGIENGVHYSEFSFYGHSCLPGTPKRIRNMMKTEITSAYMTVTNDYSHPLISTTSINLNMINTYPSQTIEPGKTTPISYISSGTELSQSYFDIAYDSNTMRVNMGQGAYVTNVTFSGAEGHVGSLLAPTKPFTKDIDYIFYFFGGPAILPPLINSFIAANLPSIVAYVSTNSFDFNFDDNIKFTIKKLDLTPQSFYCSYAALSPVHYQENNQQWNINMILNLNGKIFGSIMYHGMSMNFNMTFGSASMLIQSTININNLQGLSFTVTQLAFSIESFSINDDLLMLLKTFLYTWYKLIDTPYHLSSTLNVKYNRIIIDKLNIAINNLINITMIKNISIYKRIFHEDIYKIEETKMNYSRWMSNSKIQSKTLGQIKIPGTHNSGSYNLKRKLSQIIYENIKFLWNLSADTAPTNGQLPFSEDKIYVGRILLDYILDTALRISISQNRTIRQQLDDGIRFFDLRIYYDTDGYFYIQHGLQGPELNDILRQVRNFLDMHSTSGELVFLSISHTNFGTDPQILPSKLSTIIQNNLKPYLYMPKNSVGVKNFDFESLKNVTLSSITTTNLHITSPKVIVLNIDNSDDYYYNDTIVNTRGFSDSGRWTLNSNGVNNLKELVKLESQGLNKNKKYMYHISWIQTPQIIDIIQNIFNHLNGNSPTMLLKQFGLETNSMLKDFLSNHTTSIFNLITIDWYHVSSTVNPIEFIIKLN